MSLADGKEGSVIIVDSDSSRPRIICTLLLDEYHLNICITVLLQGQLVTSSTAKFRVCPASLGEFVAIRIEATVFEQERPFESREWDVPEGWAEDSKDLMRSKDSEDVVTDSVKGELGVPPIGVVRRPKLNSCLPVAREHPVPASEAGHDDAKDGVEDHDKVHHRLVSLEGVMVPHTYNRHQHKGSTQHQVEHEEKEVALVLQSDAIVDPWAVMVHEVDAAIADRTVMSSGWLDDPATRVALFRPKLLQLVRSLATISQESLDLRRESLEDCIVRFVLKVDLFSVGSLLLLLAELLSFARVNRTTWFQKDRHKVIEYNVVGQREPHDDPDDSQLRADSVLEERRDDVEEGVDVEAHEKVQTNDEAGAHDAHHQAATLRHCLLDSV